MIVLLAGAGLLGLRTAPDEPANASEQWLAVKPDPLVHQIGLVGKIEPDTTLTLTAPFDGNVQAKKPETRANRVATTVSEAHLGRRANQWRPRT